eukprot:TRINITY_DN4324_c0_g1_i2.p1 TRINITY_DN4324_c0_g1~~TRINITY_DN4324_c0_g1_i2.p1  ORF type:complete len:495 (+),score=104.71 TRINITY_DN4324_c0_g1_i2:102-1487(+)
MLCSGDPALKALQEKLAEEGRARVIARRAATAQLGEAPPSGGRRDAAAGAPSEQKRSAAGAAVSGGIAPRRFRPRLRPVPQLTADRAGAAAAGGAPGSGPGGGTGAGAAQVHPDLCSAFCHAVCLCVVGDEAVGKTALLAAFVAAQQRSGLEAKAVTGDAARQQTACLASPQTSSELPAGYEPTLGLELVSASTHMRLGTQSKWVQHRLMVWDTPGQPRHRGAAQGAFNCRYRPCHGACVVYDVTRRETFESVVRWVSDVRQAAAERMQAPPPISVVGAKTDLAELRQVPAEEAESLCRTLGVVHHSFSLLPPWEAGRVAASALRSLAEATHPSLERSARRRAAERWTPEEAKACAFDAGEGDADSLPDEDAPDVEPASLPPPGLRWVAMAQDSGRDVGASAPSGSTPEVVILVVGEAEAGCSSLAEVFAGGQPLVMEPRAQQHCQRRGRPRRGPGDRRVF